MLLHDAVGITLRGLDKLSGESFPFPELLADFLLGNCSDPIDRKQLYKREEFGALSSMKKDDLRFVINWLCKNHFIFRDGRFSPKLHPTKRGREAEKYLTAEMMRELAVELAKREKWKVRVASGEQRGKDKIAEAIFSDFDKNKHFCRT